MTYLYEYLVFLAEAATIVVAALIVLSALASFGARRRQAPPGVLEVVRFNDYLDDLRHGLEQAMLTPGQYRKAARREAKAQAKRIKQEAKRAAAASKRQTAQTADAEQAAAKDGIPPGDGDAAETPVAEVPVPSQDGAPAPESGEGTATAGDEVDAGEDDAGAAQEEADQGEATQDESAGQAEASAAAGEGGAPTEVEAGRRSRVYALTFEGDMDASKVSFLRHEINAILTKAEDGDEVVARVKSFGGRVHGYGLAASQLQRVRERGLKLVVAVDQVAASGGYLMAAVANQVIAAPFAVVGSIGVVAEIPNIHRLLKKHDVDVEVITAGRYKRTLTVLGENTEEGRRKFTEELEDLHTLFQEFVTDKRPGVDLQKVATGEAWYGRRAIELNLVDAIMTSDEYLMRRCQDADVFEVRWVEHKKPWERVLAQVETGLKRLTALLPGRAGRP